MHQVLDMKARIVAQAVADADIGIGGRERMLPGVGNDGHCQMRMVGVEIQQPWKQPSKRKSGQATDDDGILGPGAVAQLRADIRDPTQPVGHRARKLLALARGLRPTCAPDQQVLAQPFLKRLHMLADRALADA